MASFAVTIAAGLLAVSAELIDKHNRQRCHDRHHHGAAVVFGQAVGRQRHHRGGKRGSARLWRGIKTVHKRHLS